MNWTIWIALGAIMGLLAVGIDAFGAHALKSQLSPEQWAIFNTAVRHHMFHTMGLFVVGFLGSRLDSGLLNASGCLFLAGILLFSGSLYVYTITTKREFAMITPIGGVTFLIGWVLLAWTTIKTLSSSIAT
jgi:uncharacterized membrane protein YgdD (TMEM256/DUF423 family)